MFNMSDEEIYTRAQGGHHSCISAERVGKRYFLIENEKIFDVILKETASRYGGRNRTWRKKDWIEDRDKKETGINIKLSDLEKMGLQADDFGIISLKNPTSNLRRKIRVATKYAIGIGIPLVAAYLVADYTFDKHIQTWINENLPQILRPFSEHMKAGHEQWIRNNPQQGVHPYNFFRVLHFLGGAIIGGFASYLNSQLISEDERIKGPDYRKVKRALKAYSKNH